MTNAEWMIDNEYKFSDLNVEFVDEHGQEVALILYQNDYKNYFGSIPLVPATENKAYYLEKWLDEEHCSILNDDEQWILSQSIKPYRRNVISIHKTGKNNDGNAYIVVVYKPKKEQKDRLNYTVDKAQIYQITPNGGLRFDGMIEGREYTKEFLGL